ncbi:MAG: fatty acid desaturase, partial [Myxococcota bacterium]
MTTLSGKSLLARVPVAWPTLLVAAAALTLWTASTVAAAFGHLSLGLAALLNTVAAFAAFTPMHDASHRALGHARALSEVVGRLCALVLAAPFPAFRYVHLEHHKHTNDPVRDPDVWSGLGPRWLLPLRWLSQDLHYYSCYARALPGRRRLERLEVSAFALAVVALIAVAVSAGALVPMLLLWLVPARLATAMLALSFDYLPHRPHRVRAADDRFRASSVWPNPWLTLPLFF